MEREILAVTYGFDNLFRMQLRDEHDHEAVLIVRAQSRIDARQQAMAWANGHGTTWRIVSLLPI